MKLEEIEAYCRELAFQGMEYEEIKKELELFSLSAEERRRMLDKADEFIVQYQLYQQHKARALNQMLMGGAILAVGLATVIGSYLMRASQYVIPWGGILIGVWVLKEGYKKYTAPMREDEIVGFKKRSKFNRF